MLNFCSLYSGSTGNCLFVQNSDTKILIDCGVSQKKIIDALDSINISINEIDAILVTHEHSDHIQSVGSISKKFDIPVFANKETFDAMPSQKEKIDISNQMIFSPNEDFSVGSFKIYPFSIPHDAINPCGFNIFSDNIKISIATDLGHITSNIMDCLYNSKFILLESNYDQDVLKYSKYPYKLKTRIAGPTGHLSNNIAGQTIAKLIESGLDKVMLGHLSKENNFPELAIKTVYEELELCDYSKSNINLSVANRYAPSELVHI